ncbi:MAG TPA: tRNA lysidine(34) synthetase TilS [Terriglobales bacterium]
MPSLSQKLLTYILRQELIQAGDRVGVAVSGGADSVALLRLLLELRKELGIVLSVVHLNHQLRGEESDGDEQFVKALALDNKLEFHGERVAVKAYAQSKHLSLEAAGRELRYGYFHRLLDRNRVDRIATAHTLDDQAETILLRLVRGTGTRGLAGIYPKLNILAASLPSRTAGAAFIVRPLLNTSRKELEAYLSEISQEWREDSSNLDPQFSRNRVRHGMLPWLEENLNPSVRNTLADAAEVARAEEEYWESRVRDLLPRVSVQDSKAPLSQLDLPALRELPLALQRRVLRAVGVPLGIHLEFQHVERILQLVNEQSALGPFSVPGGSVAKSAGKNNARLRFQAENLAPAPAHSSFAYALPVPGRIVVSEIQTEFHATLIPPDAAEGYNPQDSENLMDARLLARNLQVRNWREGDRFWPAHTKAPRKIKQLLQERRVTGPERKVWPVIVSGNEIVWMRGFPLPAHLRSKNGTSSAVKIQELPLTGRP